MQDDATEAEMQHRRGARRRQQCLAAAMAIAVLLSGLNGLVQVSKAALDYGCRHGWLHAECRSVSPR